MINLYGPLFPLDSIVETMLSRQDVDFWGLTDSYEGGWHLQSYFLCLSKKVLASQAFKKVFKQKDWELNKQSNVENGELQLTRFLSDAGFKGMAYIPYSKVTPGFEEWDAKDPTHFFGIA
jgi:O-antigen biosynthesis protein